MYNNEQNKNLGRRRLLKCLVAGGGAFAAGQMLPSKWVKPVVETAVLPAHAQSSPPCCSNRTAAAFLSSPYSGEDQA